ncbi:hypothetical protein FRC12_016259 [Ceratobasidium sp. 428]|nr:hypothetical protein FRC12_016259 [Ceratobasidium sp. 428]
MACGGGQALAIAGNLSQAKLMRAETKNMRAELALIQARREMARSPLVIGDTRSDTPWRRTATGGFSARRPSGRQGVYVPPHLRENGHNLQAQTRTIPRPTPGSPSGLSRNTSIAVPSITTDCLNDLPDCSTNALAMVNNVVAVVDDMWIQVHRTNERLEGETNALIRALTTVVLTQLGPNATDQTPAKASPPKAPTEVPSPSQDSVEVLGSSSTHSSMPALEPVHITAEELLPIIRVNLLLLGLLGMGVCSPATGFEYHPGPERPSTEMGVQCCEGDGTLAGVVHGPTQSRGSVGADSGTRVDGSGLAINFQGIELGSTPSLLGETKMSKQPTGILTFDQAVAATEVPIGPVRAN